MKLSEISELHLAAVVAGATFLGGVGASLLNTFVIDAGTERQTDVQLVELAVDLLRAPSSGLDTSDELLRTWAVDTINAASPEVDFPAEARQRLIEGDLDFVPLGELERLVTGLGMGNAGAPHAPVIVPEVIIEETTAGGCEAWQRDDGTLVPFDPACVEDEAADTQPEDDPEPQ